MLFKPPISPEKRILDFPIYALDLSAPSKEVFKKIEKEGTGVTFVQSLATICDLTKVKSADLYAVLIRHIANLKITPTKIIDELKNSLAVFGLHLLDSDYSTYDFSVDILDIGEQLYNKIGKIKFIKNSGVETLGDLSILKSSILKKYGIESEEIEKLKTELAKYGIFFERNSSKIKQTGKRENKYLNIKKQAIQKRYEKFIYDYQMYLQNQEFNSTQTQNLHATVQTDNLITSTTKYKETTTMTKPTIVQNSYFSATEETLNLSVETLNLAKGLMQKNTKNIWCFYFFA